jgi:putative ABC transport system permease protein
MNPLTTPHLALNNLKQKPLRSIGLALVVGVFSFTMSGGALLSESIRNGIASMSRRLGADILVVPRGYDKKLQATLLCGEPSTFYIQGDILAKVSDIPEVTKVAPQLYLATLDASCCTLPVQIVAYDPATDFVIEPWVASTSNLTPGNGDVVVGNMVMGDIGSQISLLGKLFTIVGRLDRTGMGFDSTVFMTIADARRMVRQAKNPLVEKMKPGAISSVAVAIAPGSDLCEVAETVRKRVSADYDVDVAVTEDMISDIAKKLNEMSFFMHILTGFLGIAAACVLCLFFSLLLHERKREFGLLRIMGATRGKLAGIVLCESIMVSAIGGALGVIAALGLTMPFHRHITLSMEVPHLAIPISDVGYLAAMSLVLSVTVGPLASLYSALKIGTSDAYVTLQSVK